MKNIKLLLLAFIANLSLTTFAQTIPNNGFETWTNPNGYNVPDSWGNFNTRTASASVYTCTKGTPGAVGAAYLKLTSKNVTGLGVVPGIAVSGIINTDLTYDSGFSFTLRPSNLNGSWQYMAFNGDAGSIKVYLTRINPITQLKETVGYIENNLSGMVMSWGTFTLPFTYVSSETPDHCLIVFSASGATPVANSYLYIDNLSFDYTMATDELSDKQVAKLYPNPASTAITIDFSSVTEKVNTIEVYDMLGKLVITEKPSATLTNTIAIGSLSKGMYLVKLKSENRDTIQKFIKE